MTTYAVTLQFKNRMQFSPSRPRADGKGYEPMPYEAKTPLEAAQACFKANLKELGDAAVDGPMDLDFAIVIAREHMGVGPRYVIVPGKDVVT